MSIGIHKTHCCVYHLCKYGDEDCPVVKQLVIQDHCCELCEDDGFKEVSDIPIPDSANYDLYTMNHGDLIKECIRLRELK